MKTKTKPRFADLLKDYTGLCRVHPPRVIRDSVDYENIAEVTDAMALWQDDFTSDQRDYFDTLCSLMEAIPNRANPLPRGEGTVADPFCNSEALLGIAALRPFEAIRKVGQVALRLALERATRWDFSASRREEHASGVRSRDQSSTRIR